MDFWIVAIDHELQLQKDDGDAPNRRAQKDRLEALLLSEIPNRKVQFIAEESKIGKTTIASALAIASNPSIPWRNISMTEAERDAAGITEALKNRPGHPDYERWRDGLNPASPRTRSERAFLSIRLCEEREMPKASSCWWETCMSMPLARSCDRWAIACLPTTTYSLCEDGSSENRSPAAPATKTIDFESRRLPRVLSTLGRR